MESAVATQLASAETEQKISGKSRWGALVFLALAQFMVVLDGTIVNLALPRLQIEMGISDSTRSWVVTAYALVFGAFLLLGGRIADFWGRKRTFIVAAAGFAAASPPAPTIWRAAPRREPAPAASRSLCKTSRQRVYERLTRL